MTVNNIERQTLSNNPVQQRDLDFFFIRLINMILASNFGGTRINHWRKYYIAIRGFSVPNIIGSVPPSISRLYVFFFLVDSRDRVRVATILVQRSTDPRLFSGYKVKE